MSFMCIRSFFTFSRNYEIPNTDLEMKLSVARSLAHLLAFSN